MFLEVRELHHGAIEGAVLVCITVNGETRYCARYGYFLNVGCAMGKVHIGGFEYTLLSDNDGYFKLEFPILPKYWNSLYIKSTDMELEIWAKNRIELLLKAGRS